MRIGILAGGGRLPLMIAESAAARGIAVHIVAIRGEADPEIERFPHTWVNWGQIGRMLTTLRREGGQQLVIAGGVRRPDFWHVRPDAGLFQSLPAILGLIAAGRVQSDHSILGAPRSALVPEERIRTLREHRVAVRVELAGDLAL